MTPEEIDYANEIEDPQAFRPPTPTCEGKHFCTICESTWRHDDPECHSRAVCPCPEHEEV